MTTDNWPVTSPPKAGGRTLARGAGRRRLSSVRAEFFLSPDERLTEQERALMSAMLRDLVASVADQLGAQLGGDLEPDPRPLFDLLMRSRLLDRPALIAQLLARADEQRIEAALRSRHNSAAMDMVSTLVGDDDPTVATAAMAVVVGRGRRRDRFGRQRLELADLPPVERLALVEAVAAGIAVRFRDYDPALGARLSDAISPLVAAVSAGDGLTERVDALAEALIAAGRGDDEMVERQLAEGDVALFAALLAGRAEVASAVAFDLLADGAEGRLAALLRLAGLSRTTAARVTAELDGLTPRSSPVTELAWFDEVDERQLLAFRQWLGAGEAFRDAVERLEQVGG